MEKQETISKEFCHLVQISEKYYTTVFPSLAVGNAACFMFCVLLQHEKKKKIQDCGNLLLFNF